MLCPSQRRLSQKTGSHRPFDGLFALSSRHWLQSLCKPGKRKHTLLQRPVRPWPGKGYRMRVGDLPGPCVYCSSQTFGKRDKHNIGNSCLSSLLLPAASPSPSRWRRSAVCSSFLHACPWLFLFRRLLYVALRAALLRAFGRCPVLFSVFVPRWQPRHQRWRALFSSATFRATFACVAATRSAAFLTTPRGSTHRRQLSQTWSPLSERTLVAYLAQAAAPAAPSLAWTI